MKIENEKQIVLDIEAKKKKYEQSTLDMRTAFSDIFSIFSGKTKLIQDTPYKKNDDIPKLRTEISYIKPFIFSGEPLVEVEPVGEEDELGAIIYEKILEYRFRTIKNFDDAIDSWVMQAVTFSASEIRVDWDFKTKKTGDYETPVADEPRVYVYNHMDVFYNPLIPYVDDQECLIFRSVISIDKIKKNEAYNVIGHDGLLNREKVSNSIIPTDSYNSSTLSSIDIPNVSNIDGMVEVYEEVTSSKITTICNGYLLRQIDNPYGFIPVVKFVFEKTAIPNRYDGYGTGQNTDGLSRMFYKLFNQISTSVTMTNNPMFLSLKGSILDKRQLVSRPGGNIEVQSSTNRIEDAIKPLLFPETTNSAFSILNKVDDEHKRASGASDLTQGSSSNDTLGQDEIAQSNTSNRFEPIIKRFKQAISKLAEIILKMELQNLQSPEADILRIFPKEKRQEIYNYIINEGKNIRYNIRLRGDSNIVRNKNLENKRLIELFSISQTFLTDKEKRAFARRIAERQGVEDVDELIGVENMEAQQEQIIQQDQLSGEAGQEQSVNMPIGAKDNQELMQQAL